MKVSGLVVKVSGLVVKFSGLVDSLQLRRFEVKAIARLLTSQKEEGIAP